MLKAADISRSYQWKMLLWVVVFMGILGCGDSDQAPPASLPTRGDLVIGIDESLRPFADAEIDMFSDLYPDARITPLYLPEKQVVEKLLANEIQTGIICRDLHPEESNYIKETYRHVPRTFKLADDAIVAVVNKANPVRTISYDDIHAILSGTVTDWGQLAPSFKNKSPIVVVITGSSSIDRYFSSSAAISPVTTHALDITTEVIDYVIHNVSAIGIVGGSWFYQEGSRHEDVRVYGFSGGAVQSGNRDGRLSRAVYAVTHEPNTGLGSGFISFMASRKGQLILSKAGMTPYKAIEREVKLLGSFPE